MRAIGLPFVMAVVAAGCGGPHAVEIPKNTPPALVAEFRERNQLHKRADGARLTATAKWVKEAGVEAGVAVDWAIDYAGPRRPFAILTPGAWTDPVVAHYWHLKPDGSVATFTGGWGGPSFGPRPPLHRETFSVSADGQPLTGRLATGSWSFQGALGRIPGPGDPPLWVQLEYAPTEQGDGFDLVYDPVTDRSIRGAEWSLDAWTGRLWSPVVEVAVK